MQITIKPDEAKLAEVESWLVGIPNAMPRAIAGAINKVLPKARTGFVRAVRERIRLSYASVKDRIGIVKASPSTPSPEGYVTISRKGIPLSEYPYRATKTGIQVRTRVGGDIPGHPNLILHGFAATLASSHVGIFVRKGPKVVPTRGSYAGRLIKRGPRRGQQILRQQIEQKFGPTVLGVVEGAPGLLEEQLNKAQENLSVALDSQVDRLLAEQQPEDGEVDIDDVSFGDSD